MWREWNEDFDTTLTVTMGVDRSCTRKAIRVLQKMQESDGLNVQLDTGKRITVRITKKISAQNTRIVANTLRSLADLIEGSER